MTPRSSRFFRLLLSLAPEAFREEYGAEILATLEARAGEAERGVAGRTWFHVREGAGLLAVAIRERLAGREPAEAGALTDRPVRLGWRESMGRWVQEIRQAARRLLRSPTFTVASVVTLALGIGANTAIFTVVNGVILQPLSYPQSEELVFVLQSAPGLEIPEFPLSLGGYAHYRSQSRTLEELAGVQDTEITLTGDGPPEYLEATRATWTVFRVLGQQPTLGRTFVEDDGRPDAPLVAVISEDLWTRRFGRDRDVVGRTLEVSGDATTIVGVVADGSLFADADVWLPIRFDPAHADADSHGYMGMGRIAPGATFEGVVREMEGLVRRLPDAYPDTYSEELLEQAGIGAVVRPLKDRVVGDVSDALWVIMGTMGMVLLIACANVANLFIVRAEGRRREVAVRRALGASRGSLLRFFTGEALLLATAGAAAGLALAWASLRWLLAIAPPELPRVNDIALDGWVLAFTAAVTVGAVLFFGLLPMLRFAARRSMEALRDGGRGSRDDRAGSRARNALVVGQVALAMVLLVGSGLMVRSFRSLRSLDPGFDPAGAATFRIHLPATDYPDAPAVARFHQDVVDRVEGVAGVDVAGAVRYLPLGGGIHGSNLRVEGRQEEEDGGPPVVVMVKEATEGYFEAMGMTLAAGRGIRRRDHETREPVMVVNTAVAERFWPGEDPVGKRATTRSAPEAERWYTVVGVVESVRDQELTDDPSMVVYYPMLGYEEDDASSLARSMSVVYRVGGGGSPLSVLPAVRRAVWEMDSDVPVAAPRSLASIVSDAMSRTSFTMVLLALAAGVSVLLGAVGIFGVISYVVSRRTHEIGIRMAIGAERQDVRDMVLGQGARLVALGAALGLAAAAALGGVVEALLYGVGSFDPVTYASVTLILVAVSLAAIWLPARRATRIDPVRALRAE